MLIATPPQGVKKPPLSWAKGYARDCQRMHPNWSLRDCVREGYNLALEASNPRHRFWW